MIFIKYMYRLKNCKISIPPIKAAINPGTFHIEEENQWPL